MATIKKLLLCFISVFITACAGISVDTDYKAGTNFSELKTYAWMPIKEDADFDPLVDNDLMRSRVQTAVNNQLANQGYQLVVEQEGADFLVAFHIKAEDKLSVTDFSVGFGYNYCSGNCFGIWGNHYDPFWRRDRDLDVRQYKEGVFFIDILNPADKSLLWRGVAGRRLVTGTPEERDSYVNDIVSAILMKFPPVPKQ